MRQSLIIGGTGAIGSQVVTQLSAMGTRVRVMARNPDALKLPMGVEVVQGDLTVPQSLEPCLDGVDAVFLVWTAPALAIDPALELLTRHARRIVFLSSPYKTAHPFYQAAQPNAVSAMHMRIERLIEDAGCQWRFLRPAIFSMNALGWWARQIRNGEVVRWPYLSAATAPIHEYDIAAVAVRALCDDGHASAGYVLTGPESLSQYEQLQAIGRATGHPLRIEEISPEQTRLEWANWMPAELTNMLLKAWNGALGQPAYLTSTVEQITGTPARTFIDWAKEHVEEFQVHQGLQADGTV